MTRVITPALYAVALRAASLLTGVLVLFALTACETMTSGGGDLNAGLSQKAKPTIAFSPVQGVPEKYATKLNDELGSSAKAKGLQVVDAKDAEYIVRGAFIALPEARKGTKVTYALDVTDKAGKRLHRLEGEELVSERRGGDSWAHVNEEALQRVVAKSTAELNGWIENPNGTAGGAPALAAASASPTAASGTAVASATPRPAAQQPANAGSLSASVATAQPAQAQRPQVTRTAAAPADVVALVPPVTGAPGDGQTALSEAMKKHLGQQGVKLASAGASSAYKVQGQVEMGPADNGEQPITIRWTVLDPSGRVLDNAVVQRNKVPAGSLDGTWGPVADAAAGEAAKAVSRLLGKPAGQAS